MTRHASEELGSKLSKCSVQLLLQLLLQTLPCPLADELIPCLSSAAHLPSLSARCPYPTLLIATLIISP